MLIRAVPLATGDTAEKIHPSGFGVNSADGKVSIVASGALKYAFTSTA